MKKLFLFLLPLFFLLNSLVLQAQPRFPQPEFTNHTPPQTTTPMPRSMLMEYLDVFVLVALLSIITWFVLKKRSRKGVFWTGIFSILYFGFWKVGCVCTVGSIQNVSLALFDKDYAIPISVIAFFTIPLLFSLFFGRTFCAGVCFMGAVQELVIYKPVKVPPLIRKALGIIPYIYLAFAILLAATGADFIICRFDPFIGFFRFDAKLSMIIFGVSILILGLFVARPYCRFLCPYGVLLNWMSRLSMRRTTITPSNCIQCKLCETSCPIDAIEIPTHHVKAETEQSGTKRLLLYICLLPVFMIMGGFVSSRLYLPLSSIHPKVQLAEVISEEARTKILSNSEETKAFYSTGVSVKVLIADASEIQKQFYYGTWIMGIFLGLIFGFGLINSSVLKTNPDYVPNKGSCVSCARCYKYCPVDRKIEIN